ENNISGSDLQFLSEECSQSCIGFSFHRRSAQFYLDRAAVSAAERTRGSELAHYLVLFCIRHYVTKKFRGHRFNANANGTRLRFHALRGSGVVAGARSQGASPLVRTK